MPTTAGPPPRPTRPTSPQLLEYLDRLDPGGGSSLPRGLERAQLLERPGRAGGGLLDRRQQRLRDRRLHGDRGRPRRQRPRPGLRRRSIRAAIRASTWANHLATYEADYVAALGGAQPAIWGFHPYYAVNCEQAASVTTFEAGLPGRRRGARRRCGSPRSGHGSACSASRAARRPAQEADAKYLVQDSFPRPRRARSSTTRWPPNYSSNCSKYSDSELFEADANPGPLVARQAAYDIYGPDTTLGGLTGVRKRCHLHDRDVQRRRRSRRPLQRQLSLRYGPTDAYGSQTPSSRSGRAWRSSRSAPASAA